MRIVVNTPSRVSGSNKAGRRSGVEDGFGGLLEADEAEDARGPGSTGPMVTIGNLWALQTVEVADDRPRRALDHGRALLDDLADLQRDLTLGGGSIEKLQQIAAKVRDRSSAADNDPKLAAILDEIELRVMVELAKRDCFV